MEKQEFDPVPEEFKSVLKTSKIETLIKVFSHETQEEAAEALDRTTATVNAHLREALEDELVEKKGNDYRPTRKLTRLLDAFEHDLPPVEGPEQHHFDSVDPDTDWKPLVERLESDSRAEEPGDSTGSSEPEVGAEENQLTREEQILEYLESVGGSVEKQAVLVENLDISQPEVSQLVSDLEERGIVERQKAGLSKRVVLGAEALNADNHEESQEDIEESSEGYSFSDVMRHLSGQEDVLDEGLDEQLQPIASDYEDELFQALNSPVNLKVLKGLEKYGSLVKITGELELSSEEVKEALEKFDELGLVSVEETKYSSSVSTTDEYDEALDLIQIAYKISEGENLEPDYNDPEFEESEWTEEEWETVEKWSENTELIQKLMQEAQEEYRRMYREGERKEVEAEAHRATEFADPERVLEGYQLVRHYLKQNDGELSQAEIAEIGDWDGDEAQDYIIEAARLDGVLRVPEDDGFKVYLEDAYHGEQRSTESADPAEIESQRKEVLEGQGLRYRASGRNGGQGFSSPDIGEPMDPEDMKLGSDINNRKMENQRVQEIRGRKAKDILETHGELTYNDLAARADWSPRRARLTARWMAENNMAELYENGVSLGKTPE